MLASMTGYGDARRAGASGAVSVEIRSVNNRHLKVTVRGSDPYPMLESEVEKLVRQSVKRGTVTLQVRVERAGAAAAAKLNLDLLNAYLQQLETGLKNPAHLPHLLAGVLELPGVAPEEQRVEIDAEWPLAQAAIEDALKKLNASRVAEGQLMAAELRSLATQIQTQIQGVRGHLPKVVADFRERMTERIRQAVQAAGVTLEHDHLIREVAIFADRSDVAEELTRLDGHLEAFARVLADGGEGAGRRLEFLVQEMGREANTLGSKAGDVAVSRHAVEIKAALEKIRELVQNIE